MKRRDFFRVAGLGAYLGYLGGGLRAAFAGRTSGPFAAGPTVPENTFEAFPLAEIAPATAGFPRCHEASLVDLADHSCMAVFVREPPPNGTGRAVLWSQRLGAGGGLIGAAHPLWPAAGDGHSAGAPALCRLPDRRLGLLYTRRQTARDACRLFAASADEGATWSSPAVVAEGNYRSGCHDRFTVHSSGRLLAPLQCSENWDDHHFYVRVARSDDAGWTWQLGNRVESLPVGGRLGCGWLESGCTAPGIAERSDGTLLMTLRTAMGTQFCSESRDRGETWSTARSLEVGSPMSPAHLSRLPGTDDLLLVWNPALHSHGDSGGGLHTVMAGLSRDGGRSWPLQWRKVLLHDPINSFDSPTVSYRGGEAWITLRRTEGPYPLQGPVSTALMRAPLESIVA